MSWYLDVSYVDMEKMPKSRHMEQFTSDNAFAVEPDDRRRDVKPPCINPSFPRAIISAGEEHEWQLQRELGSLVSTISSHRSLLLPSLAFLKFLLKQGRGVIFNVERNPVLHWILKKTFYDQFCAGETEQETRACAQRFKDLGFRGVIITYAKETVFDHKTKTLHGQGSQKSALANRSADLQVDPDIEDWKLGCLLSSEMIGEGDLLAIKLTGAGFTVTSALAANEPPPQQLLNALDEIVEACRQRKIRLIIDAESQYFQKEIDQITLELMRKFNRNGFAAVFNTYQCYLKSTPATIAQHLASASELGFTLGLKIVRGAYILSENRCLIHETKQDTDDAYNGIARGALEQQLGGFDGNDPGSKPFPSVNLLVCTHNRESVIDAQRLHRERVSAGLPTIPVAFAQLHGMSDEVSFSLLQDKEWHKAGSDVFKCSTWGTLSECLAYLLRRAVENRDAVLRTTDEYSAVKRECWRRLKAAVTF
ncbi:Proline dehydrogenase 1 [Paramyrothecium foliicola]|nr:Proline dehydrogenase 1 [Paramyrothecium foliicola]